MRVRFIKVKNLLYRISNMIGIQVVTNIVSSTGKFIFIWENPPLIHYYVYYPSSKPVCIYVSFKLVELPEITFNSRVDVENSSGGTQSGF